MTDQSDHDREVFVFEVNTRADVQAFVSVLNPESGFEHGLCTEAILGVLRPSATDGQRITPDRLQENPAFIEYLRELISSRIYDLEGIRQAARHQGEGHVYLIDARTPQPDGQVSPADIIGAVQIQAGSLIAGSYQHNPNHRLLTRNGFFRLPTELETILQADLRARCAQPH